MEMFKKRAAKKEKKDMVSAKEELKEKIEAVREKLNRSIDERKEYTDIYRYSVELDQLLNQYSVTE